MRGIAALGLVLDVGFVAQPPQPQLGLLVRLAGADRFASPGGACSSSVLSKSRRPSICTMCQPNWVWNGSLISPSFRPSIACSNSGTNAPGPVQPRSPPSTAEPGSSEFVWASTAKSSPLRMRSRSAVELLLHGGIVRQLGGLHEDVAHVHLLARSAWPRAAAHLVQPDDVKAGRRAQRLAHLARLELRDDVGEEGRQLAALAPAERAAFERGLAVGVGDGELGEILAALGALVRPPGALGGRVQLRRAGLLADGDQDVRDVVFVLRRRASSPASPGTGRSRAA